MAESEAVEPALIEQIQALPPERRKEVKAFVDFLSSRERGKALKDFLAVAEKVAAAGIPVLSPEQVEAEIKALRAERRGRAPSA